MSHSDGFHAPARDRLLAPLAAPLGRALAGAAPPAALSLAGLAAAVGAFTLLLAGYNLPAGVLILLAALLDAAAAAGGRAATFGGVVDGVADRYADTLVLAGMAAWAQVHEGWPAPLAVGFVAVIGAVVLGYAVARVQASAGREAAAVLAWTGRDLRLVIAAAGTLAGAAWWALVVLAVVALTAVLWALIRLRTLLSAPASTRSGD